MYVCFVLNSTKMSRHLVTRVWSSRTHEVFCKDSVRSGGQESDLTVWRVTEQLSFRVLHGTRDGTVHESSHSELRNAQFAFQHRVLDQRKTGRPGAKTNPTVISTQNKKNGRTCFTIMICSLRWNSDAVLRDGREDTQSSAELLDGSSGFKPAVSFLLLSFEELIAEMFPLLGCERTEDPAEHNTFTWGLGSR